MGILIRGGRIVDAATDMDKTGDIYLEDGIITEIGQKREFDTLKSKKVLQSLEIGLFFCQIFIFII